MMKNSYKILFLLTLMLGSLMTISANSWIGAWMGLEINLLSFIPLMNDINNLKSSEASLKYFLTQALASSIFLFAIIMYMMKFNFMFQFNLENNFSKLIMMLSLLMKSGTAPFHFWFPEVMEGLSWNNVLILMTWQKLAPLMLISYILNSIIILIIIITLIVGSLGGLNQTSLRKILSFSSINHLGWMLSAMYLNENIWMMYFMFYSFLSFTIVKMFNMINIFHFNQMFSSFSSSKYMKMIMMINLLSLGGLPPFLGFIPKWIIIQYLSINLNMMLVVILVSMTLITLLFYLRMCFSAFMLNYYENNFMIYNSMNFKKLEFYMIFSFLSSCGLPIVISFLYFMM
uniref:NADH-ubiquinone oxidoreductase chain 2 n=1 Tax=Chrysotimus molliculus TaxID=1000613 RepID=A0A7G7CDD0_9MUSC|nr:NADH dehydrogenase subunit 2 [Chrysotimus molliculus]